MRIDLARETDFALGALRVRPSIRQIETGEATETLEPRIMQVLVAFARRKGEVVTRDELIEACWDGRVVGEDAINRCTSRVRKLGEKHGAFSLETIPRVGYRLSTPGDVAAPGFAGEPGGREGAAPMIAVLPFANRSGLAEDEVFAEGMVEDLIAAMAQGINMRVLASIATAGIARDPAPDFSSIGRQLGVRYLLEGSVRRAGPTLRVTAQLIEASTGMVLWSGRFERPLSELAALQEQLVTELAGSLDMQIHSLEMQRVLKKPGDLTAWEATRRSMAGMRSLDPLSLMRSIEDARQAVAIAPDYAQGLAQLAAAMAVLYYVASPDNPDQVAQITATAERALELGPDDAFVLASAGGSLLNTGDPQRALRPLLRALAINPGMGPVHFTLGWTYCALNRPDDALLHLAQAAKLMPVAYMLVYIRDWQANALIRSGRWSEAEALFEENLAVNPAYFPSAISKAVACWLGQRTDEARAMFAPLRNSGMLQLDQTLTLYRRAYGNCASTGDILNAIRALWAETAAAAS